MAHSNNSSGSTDGSDRTIVRTSHDWNDETSLSETVILGVASVIGKQPEAVEPLFTVVDPDALDSLFKPLSSEETRNRGSVRFTFDGCLVTVTATGDVEIEYPASQPSTDHSKS